MEEYGIMEYLELTVTDSKWMRAVERIYLEWPKGDEKAKAEPDPIPNVNTNFRGL